MTDMDPFIEALDEKVVNANCPVCDENSWSTVEDLVHVLIGSEEQSGNGPPMVRGFEAFTIACTNCGFVRMHAADALRGD
jgi:hypothetical protein